MKMKYYELIIIFFAFLKVYKIRLGTFAEVIKARPLILLVN